MEIRQQPRLPTGVWNASRPTFPQRLSSSILFNTQLARSKVGTTIGRTDVRVVHPAGGAGVSRARPECDGGWHRPRRARRACPSSSAPAVRFGDVGAHPDLCKLRQGLIAVIVSATSSRTASAAGRTASICSAAVVRVSTSVVVSPASAFCTVTLTTAPVSRSTACSAV